MQLKKLLQGSAFALVAVACAIAAPSVVKAAAASVGGDTGVTKIEMTGDQLSVTSDQNELLVGIAKVSKKNAVTVPSWGSYTVKDASTAVTVDLSKLSNVKNGYVALTTPGKDVTLVKINAADPKAKAKYVVDSTTKKGVLQVGSGTTLAAIKADNADKYEYRTAYSSQWTSMKNGSDARSLEMYEEEGAKLFVREVAVTAKTGNSTPAKTEISTVSTTETAYKYGKQSVKVLDDGVRLPGKELKVTIPAKAKGPKVTVDYTKGTVKFPKDSEYRVVKTGAAVPSSATAVTSTDPVNAFSFLKEASDPTSGNLEVRKKADKKVASKWTVVPIKKQDTFLTTGTTVSGIGLITAATKSTPPSASATEDKPYGEWKASDGSIKAPTLVEETGKSSVLSFEYKQPNAKKKEYDLVITSTSSKTYEVVVKNEKPGDSDRVTKLTSKKPITLKNVTDGEGSNVNKLWIRVAGDKKTPTWVSDWGDLGAIDVPKVVAKTGSGS